MGNLVVFTLLALLQQGASANVKNLPEIVQHETAIGENEVAGQITVHCPAQPSQALDHLLLYLNAQDSLAGQLEQLKNRIDSLDGQLQRVVKQELAELKRSIFIQFQAEGDLKATVEALQTTFSSQDNIIQQQAAALLQLQGTLQQLETTNQQQANSLQQQETTIRQQANLLQQLNATIQQQVGALQQQ
ncbi:Hypp746 [Branchiostoma lanceolatum]|uniref:Hypp746 protein n=1 Tax=Branchiostoma lanceolatum TaxID=7740 RepID=A0A8J9YK91_BRALA|nr:Hypp746 [Branchiostoma lanceolatum]